MGRDQANPGPAWHATSAHDFDGDGAADILWQNDNATPAVWLVNLQLTFALWSEAVVGAGNPGHDWHLI